MEASTLKGREQRWSSQQCHEQRQRFRGKRERKGDQTGAHRLPRRQPRGDGVRPPEPGAEPQRPAS